MSKEAKSPEETPADTLPENQVNIEDAGVLKKKVTVTVPRERIDAKLGEMFGELSKSALVPGFRIGHAPRRLIEKRFGREVGQDVRNALVGESIGSAIEKSKLNTLGEPNIDLDTIELPEKGELAFSFEIEVAPEFDLPALDAIEVKRTALEINDERINEQLEQWRQSQARFEATTDAVQATDVITADVRITGDGIDEHLHKDHVVRVAPGQIEGLPLVDLPTVLAGKKIGETATATVKVPEAHPNEGWRGKDATVELTVSAVRRRILPEIDEAFAQGAGFESLTKLRELVASNLQARLASETKRAMRDQVCKYLLDTTRFDLPQGVAARHANRVLQRRYVDLLQRGVPRERIDENLTQLAAAANEQAQADLKLTFILGKVAESQGVTVDEGEVNARIAAMANEYNRRPERMRQELEQEGTLSEIEVSIREEKALDKLLETAKVTEITVEQAAAEAAAAQAAAEKAAAEAAKAQEKAAPAAEAGEAAEATEEKPKPKKKAAKKATKKDSAGEADAETKD